MLKCKGKAEIGNGPDMLSVRRGEELKEFLQNEPNLPMKKDRKPASNHARAGAKKSQTFILQPFLHLNAGKPPHECA